MRNQSDHPTGKENRTGCAAQGDHSEHSTKTTRPRYLLKCVLTTAHSVSTWPSGRKALRLSSSRTQPWQLLLVRASSGPRSFEYVFGTHSARLRGQSSCAWSESMMAVGWAACVLSTQRSSVAHRTEGEERRRLALTPAGRDSRQLNRGCTKAVQSQRHQLYLESPCFAVPEHLVAQRA